MKISEKGNNKKVEEIWAKAIPEIEKQISKPNHPLKGGGWYGIRQNVLVYTSVPSWYTLGLLVQILPTPDKQR